MFSGVGFTFSCMLYRKETLLSENKTFFYNQFFFLDLVNAVVVWYANQYPPNNEVWGSPMPTAHVQITRWFAGVTEGLIPIHVDLGEQVEEKGIWEMYTRVPAWPVSALCRW